MHIIGQEKLKQWVAYVQEPPHCIILKGLKGSGKTLMSQYMAQEYGLEFYAVPDLKVDNIREIIADAQALHTPRLYHFEGADKMTNAAQNALLKLAEEPPEKVYILLAVENEGNLLPTISSRGRLLNMQPYTKQQLMETGATEEICAACDTIGQVTELMKTDYGQLYALAFTVATSIGKASLANVFNISKKVEADKQEMFIGFLLYHFNEQMKHGFAPWQLKAVNIVYRVKYQMEKTNVNKGNLIEMMCVDIWKEHRNELQ